MVDTNSLQVKPEGTVIKTCFYREGPYLHVLATLVKNGDCQVFKGSLDVRPIQAALVRYHKRMHGPDSVKVSGFFDSISHAISSIGHAKLVKGISAGMKASGGGQSLGGLATSIVIPPVGLPAAAAYAVAKASVGVIEEANAVKSKVTQIANSGSAAARAVAHAKLPQIKNLMAQKDAVQKKLAAMALAAKSGNKEALAAQRIFGIVLKQHQALKSRVAKPAAVRGVPAMMITRTGRVVPGHYLEQRANKKLAQAVLFDGKQILRGKYVAA